MGEKIGTDGATRLPVGPAEWTAGPWVVEEDGDFSGVVVWAARNGHDDKFVVAVSRFGCAEICRANAHLIAAAPDLLEAVTALLACPGITDVVGQDQDEETIAAERLGRAAIAKALNSGGPNGSAEGASPQ